MPNPPPLWFRAAAFIATLFVLTIFIMIAGLFSDPDLPINHWLNRHGISLLLGEVALLLVVGFLAMLTDRSAAQHDEGQEVADSTSQSDEPP